MRAEQASNLQPLALEASALPIELPTHEENRVGVEPTTNGLTGRRSTPELPIQVRRL